jgi:type IV secretion system protein VirD4
LFGVPADARVARLRDVRPLVVPGSVPPSGRLFLGRLAPRGPLLATEDRERHPARGRAARVQGDRGSVALIGPTRSGKTVLASAGIIGWDGPVVALSVKRDLYDATAAARVGRGELAVFDPGGVTGLPTARWTPLRDVTTTSGALRAGRALAQAIPRNGVTGGDFWASHGETLTSAYMCLAGLSQLLPAETAGEREPLTIGRLASWAFMHVGITDPTVNELIRLGLDDTRPLEVRLLAKDAMTKLMAFQGEDPRIRASIYATARLAFEAWTEPSVAHSASLDPRAAYWSDEIWDRTPLYVDLDWLMDGPQGRANTLYLTAPATEFARLAPVLGGLLGDLREQIHAWDIAGRRLSKPLLIVIDEAGQLELQWLPEEVSTIAGMGGMFVTGWQSRSQINHRYGSLADAVLGGHRSKIIFNGTDDPSTLDYLSRVAGTQHVAQRGWSADTAGGRKTVSEHLQREDLVPAHVIRQMRRHEAVLLHGTLPPIHLRMVRWWEDTDLAALTPTATDGRSQPPPHQGTCPLQNRPRGAVTPVLEPTVITESVGHLPTPRRSRRHEPTTTPTRSSPPRPAPRTNRSSGQTQLDLFTTPAPGDDAANNRVAGRCERCGTRVEIGAGTTTRFGGREILRCHPACPAQGRS